MAAPAIPPGAPGLSKRKVYRLNRPVQVGICADSINELGLVQGGQFATPAALTCLRPLGTSFNCPASGVCTWDLLLSGGKYLLSFASPGDTAGARVDVTAGGVYTLASGTSGVTVSVGVKPYLFPVTNTIGTGAYTSYACTKAPGAWRFMLQDLRYGNIVYGPSRSVLGTTLADALIPGGLLDQCIADGNDFIILALVINDILNNLSTSAQAFANYKTAVARINAAGLPCIYSLPSPLWGLDADGGSLGFAYVAAQEVIRVDFIRRVMDDYVANPNPLLFIEDTNRLMTDTTSTQGRAKNGFTVDGIHFNGSGAQCRAMSMFDIFELIAPLPKVAVNRSASAVYNSATQQGGNLFANNEGSFFGSGGTAGTGVTGTVPAGLTVARTNGTGITAEVSTVADVDGGSNWFQYVLSGATARFDTIRTLFSNLNIANFAVGDKIVLEFEVEIVGNGVSSVYSQINLSGITTPPNIQSNQWQSCYSGILCRKFMFTSQPFIYQAGITGVSVLLFLQTLVGAEAIARIRGGNFRKVP